MFKKLFALIVIGVTLGAAIPVDDGDIGSLEVSPLEERDEPLVDVARLVERAELEMRENNGTAPPYVCGSEPTEEEVSAAEAHFAKNKGKDVETDANAAFSVVRVYFHVIRSGLGIFQGNVPYGQLQAQINVLNANFASSRLRFVLAGGERTTYAPWFNFAGPNTLQQTQMKRARRIGGVRDLNVYTVGFTKISENGLLGYATFPWSFRSAPKDDGIVILYSTTPGGTRSFYNSGKNLVHEVGHWVGLYHTFQGGCNGGDSVADTPAEATPGFGCIRNRNTCPAPGFDPIHNFMDYSDEACKFQFTNGQIARLRSAARVYRGIF